MHKGAGSTVEPRKLVGALFRGQGLHDFDLDTSGSDVVFDTKVAALTKSDTFCTGQCSEQGKAKLGQASTALVAFLMENSRPASPTQSGFQVIRASALILIRQSSRAIFRKRPIQDRVHFRTGDRNGPEKRRTEESRRCSFLREVRSKITDLNIPRTDKRFGGLTGAKVPVLKIITSLTLKR